MLNEDANIILPCVFCCRLSGTGTGAWRGLAYAGKQTRAWSRDLDVTSDEGLVGSEWMAQLYPLPSWRIWSCGEAYSAAVRDIPKAELLYGQRVSGRNGGCTSLLGGCLFSHRWGRDGHLSISAYFVLRPYHGLCHASRERLGPINFAWPLRPLLGYNNFVLRLDRGFCAS
ncbi:hypothetical protein V8C44DRAFT_4369 [Trichoderma aethiopicum]